MGEAIIVHEIEVGLAKLRADCEAILVTDQSSYIQLAAHVNSGKAWIKDVGYKLDPGIDSAKRHYDFLRGEKAKYVDPAKAIVLAAEDKLQVWRAEEKRKADAEAKRIADEQARQRQQQIEADKKQAEADAKALREERVREINSLAKQGKIGKREVVRLLREAGALEEAAKEAAALTAEEAKAAPPPAIRVEAAVPSVLGQKNQTYYSGECTDPDALIRAFLAGDAERRGFLRQFITVSDQAIGQFARKTKDSQKCANLLPGCTFTSRG